MQEASKLWSIWQDGGAQTWVSMQQKGLCWEEELIKTRNLF